MKNRQLAVVVFALGLFLFKANAFAQCTKDTDCRAPRICNNGVCMNAEAGEAVRPSTVPMAIPLAPVTPANTPEVPVQGMPAGTAPTAPAGFALPLPNAPEPKNPEWFTGYANVAGIVSFHSWLGHSGSSDSYDSTSTYENAGYGIHVAGYWVLAPLLHLGAFCDFYRAKANYYVGGYDGRAMDNASHIGSGVSLKLGNLLSDRVWLGGVLDIGTQVAIGPHHTKVGPEVFPKLEIDVQALNSGKVKVGFFAAGGPMLAPWMGHYVDYVDSIIALQMLAGLMIGG